MLKLFTISLSILAAAACLIVGMIVGSLLLFVLAGVNIGMAILVANSQVK